MKELVSYLTNHSVIVWLILIVLTSVGLITMVETKLEYNSLGQSIQAETKLVESGINFNETELPAQVGSKDLVSIHACLPPNVTIGGQYCQNDRPYTNLLIDSSSAIMIFAPDPEGDSIEGSISFNEEYQGYVITLDHPDGTSEDFYINKHDNFNIIVPDGENLEWNNLADCSVTKEGAEINTWLVTCTGNENDLGYILITDSCSAEKNTLFYVEIPFRTCGNHGGNDNGGSECPEGQQLYCSRTGICKCR